MWALLFIAAGWQARGSVDGITIESRPVPGSSYESVRLTAHENVPADVEADAIWRGQGAVTKEVVEQHSIEETANMRIFYEVIAAPMISARDAVVKVERSKKGGVYRIAFRSIDDPRVPKRGDRIRIKLSGKFEVSPAGAGASIVTYEVFTDLGGKLPGWMVNNSKREALVSSFKKELARGDEACRQGCQAADAGG